MLVFNHLNQNTKDYEAIKLLSGFLMIGVLTTSCYTEVILEDDFIEESSFNTDQVLQSYDLVVCGYQ